MILNLLLDVANVYLGRDTKQILQKIFALHYYCYVVFAECNNVLLVLITLDFVPSTTCVCARKCFFL